VSVKRNIAANFLGSAWTALIQIAFVPLYIRYLGIEAYGLIGIYAMLQVLLSLLDMGLTPTLSREMARFKAGALSIGQIRALLRSIELVFLGVGLVILFIVAIGAPWLAEDWLKAEVLPIPAVTRAIHLMGGLIALRWLAGLYRGVILGLQHLVWLNSANAVFATLRGAGVVLVLVWISPSIEAFFLYQACVALLELFVLFRKVWRWLPSKEKPLFSREALRDIWRFSAGLSVISMLVVLLIQTDKMLLSRMLSLEAFGYYALASAVAGSVRLLIGPISAVAYPRLTELVVHGDEGALAEAYHRFSQMLTLILAPSALVLALFSEQILMLWIQDATTVNAVAPLATLLTIGFLLNGFMSTPHSLMLAHGRTRFIIVLYVFYVAIFVPAIYFGVSAYGAIAAGYAWIALNASCVIFSVPLIHRKLMPREQWRWYGQDVALPAGAAFAGACAVYLVAPRPLMHENWTNLMVIAAAFLFALSAAIIASPFGRESIVRGWLSYAKSRA